MQYLFNRLWIHTTAQIYLANTYSMCSNMMLKFHWAPNHHKMSYKYLTWELHSMHRSRSANVWFHWKHDVFIVSWASLINTSQSIERKFIVSLQAIFLWTAVMVSVSSWRINGITCMFWFEVFRFNATIMKSFLLLFAAKGRWIWISLWIILKRPNMFRLVSRIGLSFWNEHSVPNYIYLIVIVIFCFIHREICVTCGEMWK